MTPQEIAALQAENAKLRADLHREQTGLRILTSKYTAGLKMPADVVSATFAGAFRRSEEGKTFAVDGSGAKLYSRRRPGELADFDEALQLLVERHPNRDLFVKGSPLLDAAQQGPASGENPGAKGKVVYTRKAFDAMDPVQRMTVVRAADRGEAAIVN